MIGFIGTSITSTLTYNQLQQLTINDCLRLSPFHTGLRVSSLPMCDWLGSDLRISHFFSFRCPLVNTQTAEHWTLLRRNYDSLTNAEWLTHQRTLLIWTNFQANRIHITISKSSCITLSYPLPWECAFSEPLASNELPLLFVVTGTYVTEPLPSNGHILHSIFFISFSFCYSSSLQLGWPRFYAERRERESHSKGYEGLLDFFSLWGFVPNGSKNSSFCHYLNVVVPIFHTRLFTHTLTGWIPHCFKIFWFFTPSTFSFRQFFSVFIKQYHHLNDLLLLRLRRQNRMLLNSERTTCLPGDASWITWALTVAY
jgi:hypothetical protein